MLLFLAFFASLAKAAILVCIGLLLKKHFDIILTFFIRASVSRKEMTDDNLISAGKVIQWIGLFIIVIGVCTAITAFVTMFESLRLPLNNMQLKFN